jgi:aryl-alcohol dehydrogenase-like predicted oxidoreductase
MFAWQFAQSLHVSERSGWTKFVSMQNHYNLIYREEEREMNPLCRDQGIGLIPWSPLARGFLAGNRNKQGGQTSRANTDQYAKDMYYQDDDFAVAERLSEVAKERGLPNMQVALAWVLAKPGISAPIIGASKMPHLEDALTALTVKLTEDEIKQLEQLYKPHPILGHS